MAQAAGRNWSTILSISSNIWMSGGVKAPPNHDGWPRSITPVMPKAVCDYLIEKPASYLDEMAIIK